MTVNTGAVSSSVDEDKVSDLPHPVCVGCNRRFLFDMWTMLEIIIGYLD